MALPSPEQYNDWREYARALVLALQEDDPTAAGTTSLVQYGQELAEEQLSPVPDGWAPVWWSIDEAQLYLANKAFDPPQAPALFQIDTQNLAAAAVETQKIKDGAVDFFKIFDGAVGEQKLADLAVTRAKIGYLAVGSAQVQDAAIVTAKIADAAIVSALIGDAQIVTAKIADLAVNNAKLANLVVTSAKIALLAVGNTHIQDAAITRAKVLDGEIINAKIGNIIQSSGYDGVNGWQIDKLGNIRGTSIAILNPDGSVGFASGSKINLANQVIGALALGGPNLAGFGSLAAISLLTSSNITTYIQGAAIGSALIANAAIGTAAIDNLAVTSAKIANLSVDTLKIADRAVSSSEVTYNGDGNVVNVGPNAQAVIATVALTNVQAGSRVLIQAGAHVTNFGFGDPDGDHREGELYLEYQVNDGPWTRDTAIGSAVDRFYSVDFVNGGPLKMRTGMDLKCVGQYPNLGHTTGSTLRFRVVGWCTAGTNGWPWKHRRGYIIATETKK